MKTIPRAVLVTGATSGIGHAFAHALPDFCTLLLTGRDHDALQRLADALGRDRTVETVQADLTTEAGLDAVCVAADRIGIDLLVCNAGQGPFGDFLSVEEQVLRDTVSLNVMAPVVLLRRLLPGMLARAETTGQRAGLIVLSSGFGFVAVPRVATYAASKAFDLSLTEALAAELTGQPIDVLALCPTITRSQFGERSGFGRMPPVAQPAGYVARRALAALGRQRTLVLGPVSGSLLTVPALVRASLAQTLHTIVPRR